MKNKKGASELIAYVLLIGFTIALAAFVTNWVIDQTKKFNPEEVAGGAKVYCEEVVLGIEKIEGSLTQQNDAFCKGQKLNNGKIDLKNKGKFTIYGVKILGEGADIGNLPDPVRGLKPGEVAVGIGINFCKEQGINIEIIPQIEVEKEKYYCAQGSAIINDDVLASITSP